MPTVCKYGLCRSRHLLSLDYLDKITHFLSTINFIAAWGHDLLLLCRGIITQSSVGEGFAFLMAVRLIWILAVCWPLRQEAELSLVRWPCFGWVGRVSVWPGPQLVGTKPCALAKKHHSARRPPISSKNYFQRLFDHAL
jgi:hypothetical protein